MAHLMQDLGFDHSADEIRRRLALAPDRTTDQAFLAEMDDGLPVGLMALHIAPLLFYPQPLARITTMVVAATARRRGVGRALVEHAAALARQAGCDRLELTSGTGRADAHAFYAAVGFSPSALGFACPLT